MGFICPYDDYVMTRLVGDEMCTAGNVEQCGFCDTTPGTYDWYRGWTEEQCRNECLEDYNCVAMDYATVSQVCEIIYETITVAKMGYNNICEIKQKVTGRRRRQALSLRS